MRNLIFGLARPMMRLLGRDERGAIGVLIAVLMGGGVLLGMGALAIDVGRLYQNRAELQNGADAAALAVAESCASGTCNAGLAGGYANANASNLTAGKAAVDLVCGTGSLGAGCVSPLLACPANPAAGTNYVDVRTSTGTPSGLLPPVFARTILGNSGYAGTNVKACAQAEWGPAIRSGSLAFTISLCAWDALTGNGANPYGTELPLVEHGSAKTCSIAPSGLNLPGGFGWLSPNPSPPDPPCTASITLTQPGPTFITETKPGNSISGDCQTALKNDINTVVYLPIFSGYTGNGSNGTYTVAGIAAFYLNGWVNMNPLADSVPPGMTDQQAQDLCASGAASGSGSGNGKGKGNGNSNSNRCLLGYFTHGIVPVTGAVGPPGTGDFGAEAVQLTG